MGNLERGRRFRIVMTVLAATTVLGGPPIAVGHHSFARFDAANPVTLSGTVRDFRWVNPHTWVVLAVVADDGNETVWELEHGPTNMLSRLGWTSTTLGRGDRIAVVVHPTRDGLPTARFIEFEFLDGRETAISGPVSSATILDVPRPDPVPMTSDIARDLNGIWMNANGGIHFDSTVARGEQEPPLRPEFMRAWRQRQADESAGRPLEDPTASCIPPGFPRFLGMVYPSEILQTDHQINWYAEWGESTVRIYLDGRDAPENLEPSYNGFTSGRWNGDTLETRTVGLRRDTLIDTTGVPHSDRLAVAMRVTKITPDYLEVEVTLDDPIVFLRPWTTIKHYVRAPAGSVIQEFSCFEGNR